MRNNILALSCFPALAPAFNGRVSRLLNFYMSLSKWHNITLLSSTYMGLPEEVVQHGPNFVECRVPKDMFFVEAWAMLAKHVAGGGLSALSLAASGKHPTLLHEAFVEAYENADIVFHDSPFTIAYDQFAGSDNKLRVYNASNCETMVYRRSLFSTKFKPIHEIVWNAEQTMLEKSDLVLYCNTDDRDAFRLMAPNASYESLFAPNGIKPANLLERMNYGSSKTFRAVFLGSGAAPNVEAAQFIAHLVAPHFPNVMFDIVGSCFPEGVYPSNVVRHGVVDEDKKMKILCQADIALNPASSRSGSNPKVLEYFACGLPVVSTSFGMRGVNATPNVHYVEAPIDRFNELLAIAVSDTKRLNEMGLAGYSLVANDYTWDAIAESVSNRLKELMDQRCGVEG